MRKLSHFLKQLSLINRHKNKKQEYQDFITHSVSEETIHFLTSFLLIIVHNCEHCDCILIILVVFEALHKLQKLLFLLSLREHWEDLLTLFDLLLLRFFGTHIGNPNYFKRNIIFRKTIQRNRLIFFDFLISWLFSCGCSRLDEWFRLSVLSICDYHQSISWPQ